jgi:hypothetical protein
MTCRRFKREDTVDNSVERIIQDAIDEALEAVPGGDDHLVVDWVMTHRYPLFAPEVHEALRDEGLKEAIRQRAEALGVQLEEQS